MANVLLTTYCNRNCKYCFAKSKVDLGKDRGDPSGNMSMAGLEKIIAFYKTSQLGRFVVLGGEPTLHPEFPRMIDRILQEKDFDSVIVFSNGIVPDSALDYFSGNGDPRLKMALNLNSPDNHTPRQWRQVSNTMKTLGKKIGLGVNIYKPGQDCDYIIDAIKGHNLSHHVRMGLTHPIAGTQNEYARDEDFPQIAEDLLVFAEKTFDKDIGFSFDCGFRFCMFTLDQHKELLRLGVKFRSMCDPIIDIGPDLSLWRCFPLLNDVAGHLDDFENRRQVNALFGKKYRNIQRMGNLPACPQCVYRKNELCCGGCLARTIISFHR